MARASTPTLLSLDRFARIFGMPPLPFNQALTVNLNPPVFPVGNCSSVWYQYDWQNYDQSSREQVAMAIDNAEKELAGIMGFYPAPKWIYEEEITYPRMYNNLFSDSDGLLPNGLAVSVHTKNSKLLGLGKRAVTLQITVSSAPGGGLVYSDADSDGFYETATITTAVAATDKKEVKLYFAGHSGDPTYEIRPVKSKTLVGGVLTVVLDSWLLIKPDLWEHYPTDTGTSVIDASTTANFVTSVEIYREYNDTTVAPITFYWEGSPGCSGCGGNGCELCLNGTQDGCASIRDANLGNIVPYPAEYYNGTWAYTEPLYFGEPRTLKVSYLSGAVDSLYLQGVTHDPLSNYWAEVIAWLALTRLERDVCGCGSAQAIAERLRVNLIESTSGGSSYYPVQDVITNPLGTRMGEFMAWKRVQNSGENRRLRVAVI